MINVIIREPEGTTKEIPIRCPGELKATKLKEYLVGEGNKYAEFEFFCDGVRLGPNTNLETLGGIIEFKKDRQIELSFDSEEEEKYPLYLKAFTLLNGTPESVQFEEDGFKEDTPVVRNSSLVEDSFLESIKKQLHLIEPDKFKMNLVLDIDSTFFFARTASADDAKYNPFLMEVQDNGKICYLSCVFRPGLEEFLKEVSPYFDIHLNTHGTLAYCEQVKLNLEKHFGVVVNRWYGLPKQINEIPPDKSLKQLDFTPEMEETTLIIDDKFEAWEMQYQPLIIPSKAFFGFTGSSLFKARKEEEVPRILRIPLGMFNKLESFQFEKGEIDDMNDLPFNCEFEYSKKKQLYYVGKAMLNVHRLLSRGMNSATALESIRRAVLNGMNAKVDLIGNPQLRNLCSLVAFHLGSSENGVEIWLVNQNEINNWPKDRILIKLNWLLDCFYFLERIPFKDYQAT